MSIVEYSHRLKTALSSLVMFLTEPSWSLEDLEKRRQARLASGLLIAGLISFGLNAIVRHKIWVLPVFLILFAYILSRTRYYRWGIYIYTLVLAVPSFVSVFPVADQGMYRVFFALAWLMFPILLTGLVSSVRNTFIVTVLLLTALIMLPRLLPALDMVTLMPSLGFLWTLSMLIALATAARQWYSNQVERNLQQLKDARSALQQAHDELEERVEARTLELQQANERLSHEIREREMAQREALEALRVRSQILANVSHDSRTPLSVIMLRTELMKRGTYGPLTARQEEVLNSMLLNAQGLLEFIENLLQESRLDSTHKVNPGKRDITLADWLEEFIATVEPLAEQKGLALVVSLADDMPEVIHSDPIWLRHILNNLVSNAVKFTDEGIITVHFFLSLPGSWGVSVQDTGRGIPPEAHEHIFKAFWQVDGSMTRTSSRGVGLGLSIVSRLVNMLEGQVNVESEPGVGSIFTVTLPLR